jgi:hypothetical protein
VGNEMNRQFSEEEMQMKNKYMKRTTSIHINKIKNQTTQRFNLTSIKRANMKLSTINACKDERERKHL